MDFQKIRHILIFCLVLMFATAVGKAQEPQDEASAKPCADQRKRIAAELAMPHKVTWMGTYNAFSSTFSLAPSAGFYYFRGSDYVYWSCAWGQVEIVDGKIELIPDSSVPAEGTQGLELEWTPVVWGERNYIIPTDKLLDFVNSVNNGYEPDSFPGPIATFHKKAGDGERAVSGFPSVPESYTTVPVGKTDPRTHYDRWRL